MKRIVLVAGILMAGCQATGHLWGPVVSQDQFTDNVTKMVTVGEGLSDRVMITMSLKYYPFVGVRDGEIYTGIRSGGRYRVPVGTVQIRIDNNKAWTISPEETPIHLAPSSPAMPPIPTSIPGMTETIAKTQEYAMANAAKVMSPYTATTGAKARAIIKEMINGKVIKYRIVGFNQAASTTGEINIDESFLSSLKEIGIDPNKI